MSQSVVTPLVIKIGGRALADMGQLESLFQRIFYAREERPCVLVHGGGSLVDEWLQQFERPVLKTNGLRMTPTEDIPIVVGALAGALNTRLVAAFNHAVTREKPAQQAVAVGVTLADAGWCKLIHDSGRGAVGIPDAQHSSAHYLTYLLGAGLLPVVSSIGTLADGSLANVNADLAAAVVAAVLGAELLLLTDVDAILDKNGQVIDKVTPAEAARLIAEGTVLDGMRVKLEAALEATRCSRRSTAVAAWYSQAALTALLNGQATATRIDS